MPGNPLTDQNWAADVTQQITGFVGTVRDKTTNNAIKVVRAVVYGLFLILIGTVAVVLLLLTLTRGLQVLLDLFLPWSRAVYISYLVLGGILSALGLFLMNKRVGS